MISSQVIDCGFTLRTNPNGADTEEFLRAALADTGAGSRLGSIHIGQLAALAYPDAGPERLRVAALWFAFFWLFDDAWSDRLPRHAVDRVDQIHDDVAAILDGRPAHPRDHPALRLLGLLLDTISALDPDWDGTAFRREVRRYVQATRWEIILRDRGTVPALSEYLRMRPLAAAVAPSRELNWLICDLRLHPALATHPMVALAEAAAGDYSCWVNDICSLRRERGDPINIVPVAMREFDWPQRRAITWATRLAEHELATFQTVRRDLAETVLPRMSIEDRETRAAELDRYLAHYEGWFVASARWMPTTPRYR